MVPTIMIPALIFSFIEVDASLSHSSLRHARKGLRQHQKQEPPPWAAIDVVVVSKFLGCHAKLAVAALQRHLKPGKIWLIVSDGECEKMRFDEFSKISERGNGKISCISESSAVPGLSLKAISQGFKTLEEGGYCAPADEKDATAGWFLQQFLKIGFATANPELVSDYFLVWDADMVITGSYKYYDDDGKVLFPAGGWDGDEWTYRPASEILLDGTQFVKGMVNHHMMMQKPYVLELLHKFEQAKLPQWSKANETSLPRWVQNAMIAACDSNPNHHRRLGFSEYATYATFVLNYHSAHVRAVDRGIQPYSRFGGHMILKADLDQNRLDYRHAHNAISCMSEHDFNTRAKQLRPGYLILGLEKHENKQELPVGTHVL